MLKSKALGFQTPDHENGEIFENVGPPAFQPHDKTNLKNTGNVSLLEFPLYRKGELVLALKRFSRGGFSREKCSRARRFKGDP